MNALILAPFSDDHLEALRRLVRVEYESWTTTRRLYDPGQLIERLNRDNIAILVVEADFIFREVFEESKKLKFLGVCRSSLDHVDLKAATEYGVLVINTPERNARSVAELTLTLVLSLARQIPWLDRYVKDAHWQNPVEAYISHKGIEIEGKTLGIIGLGSVGRIVSKLAQTLGMKVLAYDPYVGHLGTEKAGATLASLETVLTQSKFLSLHAPSSPATLNLLGERQIGMMEQGSFLINTASEDLVDEIALVQFLESGHLAGAALDVHKSHPIVPSSPLLKLDNVILTPHVGGATEETIERHSTMMFHDIDRFMQGQMPWHLTNPQVWNRDVS